MTQGNPDSRIGEAHHPTRVLFAVAWEPTSGLRSVYETVAAELSGRGYEFSAFAFDGWSSGSTWGHFCTRLLGDGRLTLAEALLRMQPDVLHCVDTAYSPPYGVEVAIRRARFRGGVILNSHQSLPVLTSRAESPHVVVAASDAARAGLQGMTAGPVRVVNNGVDLGFWSPNGDAASAGKPMLVWVGRTTDLLQKAPEGFLALAVALADRYRFVVVDGDSGGPQLDFKRWAPHVERRHTLSRSDLRDVYRQAAASGGAVVSTSRYEAFQLVVAEALACGCPAVAPRIPGLAWLSDSVPELTYSPDEGLSGIESALARLAVPEVRERLVVAARELITAKFSKDQMVAGYERAYRDALAAVRPGRGNIFDAPVRRSWGVALSARRLVRGRLTRGRSRTRRSPG